VGQVANLPRITENSWYSWQIGNLPHITYFSVIPKTEVIFRLILIRLKGLKCLRIPQLLDMYGFTFIYGHQKSLLKFKNSQKTGRKNILSPCQSTTYDLIRQFFSRNWATCSARLVVVQMRKVSQELEAFLRVSKRACRRMVSSPDRPFLYW
jgi:hypothetical protein